jgi:MFS family permease
VALLAPQVGKLAVRRGFRTFVIVGPLIYALSSVLSWRLLDARPRPLLFLLLGEVVAVGVACFIPSNTAASVSNLPPQRLSIGGGVTNTSRQVGSVLGIAALVAVLGSPASPSALLNAHRHGFLLNCVFGLVAAAIGFGQPTAERTKSLALAAHGPV